MRLDDLRVLASIEATGSLAGAAREVGVGRATARRRLTRLAEELGDDVLEDGELTELGRVVASAGADLGARVDTMLERARASAARAAGQLLLVAPPGAPPEALTLFHRLVSDMLGKRLVVWIAEDPVAVLGERGDIGIVLAASPPMGPWAAPRLIRADRRLVATEAWIAEHGPFETLEQILEHPLFCYATVGQEGFTLPLADGTAAPVEPSVASNDIHSLRTLVATGAGVGFLPNAGALDGPGVVPLVEVLPGLTRDQFGCYMILPDATRRNPAVRMVLGMMKTALGDLGLIESGGR